MNAQDGDTESVLAAAVASLLEDLKEAPVVDALVRRKELSDAVTKLQEHRDGHLRSTSAIEERLELARSEVRRNILAVVECMRSDFDGAMIDDVGARLMPAADLAVAEAAIRAAHGDKVRVRRFVLIEVQE